MNKKDKLNQNAAEQATNAHRTEFANFLLSMSGDSKEAFTEWADKLDQIEGPVSATMLDIINEMDKNGVVQAFAAVRDDFKAGKISEEGAFYKLAFLYQAASFEAVREENARLTAACALNREMNKQILSLTDKMQLCIDYIYENTDDSAECAKALAAIDHLKFEVAQSTTDEGREKFLADRMHQLLAHALGDLANLFD